MQSVLYHQWCPPGSPLEIEFPAELVAELWPDGDALETSGVLYGFRSGREVRVLTAQAHGELDQVGIFVARVRGEVFLTEANLELFERHKVPVALVRAGPKAGFFVREANGSMQTVRSHQEFAVDLPPPQPKPVLKLPAVPKKPAWAAAGFFALTLPLLAFFRPTHTLGLAVHEQAGQLLVSWTPGEPALLEIEDGGRHIASTVFANQANATYANSTGDVAVNLTLIGGTRRETARFVAPKPKR